jgi:hypothetical protein
MLIAHVAPWKFALGRCLHKREMHHHHGPHDHHHGHHHHHHDEPSHSPFAPLLSWLPHPFGEHHHADEHARRMSMNAPVDHVQRVSMPTFPFMRHMRARLFGFRNNEEARATKQLNQMATTSSSTEQEHDGAKVTKKTSTDESGTTHVTEVKKPGMYFKSMSFESHAPKLPKIPGQSFRSKLPGQ